MIKGNGEQQVTVLKDKLLGILRDNKAKHVAAYEQAKKDFHAAAQKALERRLVDLKEGKLDAQGVTVHVQAPTNHAKQYDRVIGMLELHVEDRVSLDAQGYAQYVEDEWGYTQHLRVLSEQYRAMID